jgi:hypothetical protein
VPGSLKDFGVSKASAADFKHVFLEDEMLAPETLNVVLDGGAERTEIVEARYASIDFEGWGDEELALEQVLDLASAVLLSKILILLFFNFLWLLYVRD